MTNYHFIGGDGKTYGPYPLEKLQEFKSQNRLDGETKVQKDGGEFQPASEFPELMATGVPPTQQATAHPQPQYGTPQPGAPYYAQPVYDTNAKPGQVQAIYNDSGGRHHSNSRRNLVGPRERVHLDPVYLRVSLWYHGYCKGFQAARS